MRVILLLLSITLLFSCKSKQKVIDSKPDTSIVTNASVENVIKNHYAVKRDFKTAYFKADVDYSDPKQSLNVSADIRIKKDEIILVSVKFLGFTVAKAMITPTQVRYYEKTSGKFFEGDYKTLSNWLGTELNFQKVQNMLLGQTIDNLSEGKYTLTMDQNMPKLEDNLEGKFKKSFVFDVNSFWLNSQEITQKIPLRTLKVNYSNYKSYPESVIPGELLIFANQENKTTTIEVKYKNATFNEELTYPYSVPNGYEQIKIN
ncbi:DUF4292 domain-containing protein [Flavobacterium sp.]|uniref:DUF4292 domain-containing protein n=1 Tax=Flavobacterium sp. TaxID=239 RepID=UPI00286C8818|nr:DUF4292 domain-containing protein [Flavobacterium sp.]